uniref:ATP-binding cassette domain-containing protein n=1 Tax=Staphylococcus hominis TaxID=1290 RepID=UPI0011A4DB9D
IANQILKEIISRLSFLNNVGLEYLNLDRIVTLDGHNLSGGEAQCLSLARLLLRSSADFWILDEPTTALDINNT